jgi:hypothetical protein
MELFLLIKDPGRLDPTESSLSCLRGIERAIHPLYLRVIRNIRLCFIDCDDWLVFTLQLQLGRLK